MVLSMLRHLILALSITLLTFNTYASSPGSPGYEVYENEEFERSFVTLKRMQEDKVKDRTGKQKKRKVVEEDLDRDGAEFLPPVNQKHRATPVLDKVKLYLQYHPKVRPGCSSAPSNVNGPPGISPASIASQRLVRHQLIVKGTETSFASDVDSGILGYMNAYLDRTKGVGKEGIETDPVVRSLQFGEVEDLNGLIDLIKGAYQQLWKQETDVGCEKDFHRDDPSQEVALRIVQMFRSTGGLYLGNLPEELDCADQAQESQELTCVTYILEQRREHWNQAN